MIIMFMTILLFTLMMMITLIIPMINLHKMHDREKNSPFECGFDPFSNFRTSFSIQFFIITLMFLIFDIEITLILPLPIMSKIMNPMFLYLTILTLLIILILGLIIEWKEGSMEWK